jgi:predicted Rossmann fold flavoprotein
MKIAIIGAGASGITAALQAAWRGASVTLFERNAVVGRKLLVTGSGRCNITNDGVAAEKYTCADPTWMETLLAGFRMQDVLEMLRKVGILAYKTSDGWYYPLSDSAHTVAEAFQCALEQADVSLRLSSPVVAFSASPGDRFIVQCAGSQKAHPETFERLIIAAGGKAYPALGSRGELFPLLKQFGHTLLPKRPALAPVLAEGPSLKGLQGVRLDAGVSLWDGGQRLAFAAGNLIFMPWGLNGPAVMDISHHISANPARRLVLSLNLTHFCEQEFDDFLRQNRASRLPVNVFLGAFFPPKAVSLFLSQIRLPEKTALKQVDDGMLKKIVDSVKDARFQVKGVRDFEFCQLTAGGVPVSEVNPQTLESKCTKGLYLTGETLDVVGPCGGYNLHYAFASGALAGSAAADPSLPVRDF